MNKYIQTIEENREIAKKYIETKLKNQLILFFYIVIIILLFGTYEMLLRKVELILIIFGIFLGLIFGFIAGRIFKICWSNEMEKVISKLDRTGLFVLVIYILINIIGEILFRKWIDRTSYLAFVLFFCAGILVGRLLAVISHIKRVLVEERKI